MIDLLPRAALLLLVGVAPLAAQDQERARQLFLTNCASCHGETGDGQGTTQLDRPARSFMDGGFSFGNTPEALFKTISTGIPGSPMAGFDGSLSEEERRLVASYVVTLGPPITEVRDEDMILAVKDKPLIVRGLLPSLGEGLPEHPRGLLIGDPSGITFEYRVDDVRLLALRQGGFVKRTDWTGRGGTPLEPLGKVVHLVEGGKPGPLFSLADGSPLEARLAGTRIFAKGAEIDYHLVKGKDEVAHVVERPGVQTDSSVGTGFARGLRVTGVRAPARLRLQDPTQGPGEELYHKEEKMGKFLGDGSVLVSVRKHATGIEMNVLWIPPKNATRKDGGLELELVPGATLELGLTTIPLPEWNDTLRKQWDAQ